jgi:hypothetical protein
MGVICWWNWHYNPRIWNDGMIFENTLVLIMEYGERHETDGGYWGCAPKKVWGESGKHAMHQKVRLRQLTVSKQLKNWATLVTPNSHNFQLHQTVLAAVIALLQLSLEYNQFFSAEYDID